LSRRGRSLPANASGFDTHCDSISSRFGCHSQKIAHRDLKPDNVMYDERTGLVKLIDFGLSKDLSTSLAVSRVGTLAYVPPEIIACTQGRAYDPLRSDMWSLGVGLYVMACRDYPFGFDGRVGRDGAEAQDVVVERITTGRFKERGTQCHPVTGRAYSLKMEQRCTPALCELLCALLQVSAVDAAQCGRRALNGVNHALGVWVWVMVVLQVNPTERLDLSDVRSQPWMMARPQ
jgi:serine/threonine protein kinase